MPEAEDTQLEIKKRARRRLVGAIALSLFAIVVFPMVMDRDPGPLVQDIEIRIPDQDDRNLNARLAVPPPEDEAPASANPATPPAPSVINAAPVVAPLAAAPAPAPEATAKPAPASEKTTVRVLETTHTKDAKPAEKPADKSNDNKPKPAVEKSTDKPADKTVGAFVIQIGAFSNEGNIKNLRNKLNEQGIKSFTEPLGDKTRVRAGPFATREAAEKALQKMKSIGVSGQIAAK